MNERENALPSFVTPEQAVIINDIDTQLATLEIAYQDLERKAEAGEPVSFVQDDVRTMNLVNGQLVCWGKKGVVIPVTWGEVRTAAMFGYEFQFGESHMSPQYARAPEYIAAKRAFIVSEYQRRQRQLHYLRQAYLESINPLNQRNTDVAYEAWYEDMKKEDTELSTGKLAEKLFSAYLIRETQDKKLYVTAYDPGPIEDIDYKVDIMLQGRFRDGQLFHYGIQFSTDGTEENISKKMKLADRGLFKRHHEEAVHLDWYHLITSEAAGEALITAYKTWRTRQANGNLISIQKCDPRGPLHFLDEAGEEELQASTADVIQHVTELSQLTASEFYKMQEDGSKE